MSIQSYVIGQLVFGIIYGMFIGKYISYKMRIVFWEEMIEVKKIEIENKLEMLKNDIKNMEKEE